MEIELLDAGVPVDSVDGDGDTALRSTAFENRTDVTRVLLKRGADVDNRSDDDHERALHVAVMFNNTDFIEVLLKHGASTKIEDRFGHTPVDLALEQGSEALIRLLERH